MSASRPFTRAQTLENAAFLRALRRTGNAHAAARELGLSRSRFTRRRGRSPAFAAQWEAAQTLAQARLGKLAGGAGRAGAAQLVHLSDGRFQLREALPGRIDSAAQQRFLMALAASANVRLAARAAGFSHASFYHHKRTNPSFAREWKQALQRGYEAIESALLESWKPEAHGHDHWAYNDPPAVPPMTLNQALQLLYLHQKEARLWAEPEPLRRRRGESHEARSMRLTLVHEARMEHQRELFRIAEAARRAKGEPARSPHEPPVPTLPDLAQVKGWTKASGQAPHDPDRALFGGWRLKEK